MEELDIKITKLEQGQYIISPKEKGDYNSERFWVAHITGFHRLDIFKRKYIQKGGQAHIDKSGVYEISCDLKEIFVLIDDDGYQVISIGEVIEYIMTWG